MNLLFMPENTLPTDDYISIRSFKNIFLEVFEFVFRAVRFIVLSLHRKLFLFLLCCFAGLTAGYIYYWQYPRYFKTEMIVQHNDLNRKTYYEIIKNLNDLLVSQSYSNFASQLRIKDDLVKGIGYVEAVSITNEPLLSDTSTKMNLPFKIQIKTKDNSSLPALQNALLVYLNSNPYLKLVREGQKKIYADKLKFIEQEQVRLDSLKMNYNIALTSMRMPTTFYNNALDPADLYVHSLDLANEKEDILKWLNDRSESILLIDGFKIPANPQAASLTLSLLIGLSLGFVTGVIVALLAALQNMIGKL